MVEVLSFTPKDEYVFIRADDLDTQRITENLLRGDKLVKVHDVDIRDYVFSSDILIDVIRYTGLNVIYDKRQAGPNYVIDFLWKLATLKHEYTGSEFVEYIKDNIDTIDTLAVIKNFPDAVSELEAIAARQTGKADSITTRIYSMDSLTMRAIFFSFTGVYIPKMHIPVSIHKARINILYYTALYVLDILDPQFNDEGLSIMEICSKYYGNEYTLISLAISRTNPESNQPIIDRYGMTGTRPLEFTEIFKIIHDYIDRGYFDSLDDAGHRYSNKDIAEDYDLPDDFTRDDILRTLDQGESPNKSTAITNDDSQAPTPYQETPDWVLGVSDCVNGKTPYMGNGPREDYITKGDGLWVSYGYPGDRVCFSISELVSSYDKEKGVIKVPGNDKIASASMVHSGNIRSTLASAFTYEQISPLVDLLLANSKVINGSSAGKVKELISIINGLVQRFSTLEDIRKAYVYMFEPERHLFVDWLNSIINAYKAIDTNNKTNKDKCYVKIGSVESQFNQSLSTFVDKLSLINNANELVLGSQQGGLRNIVKLGMNNNVCDHTAFLLSSKTASKLLNVINE